MTEQSSNEKQKMQEDEYLFPYHYLDLVPEFQYIWVIPESYRSIVAELIGPAKGQRVLDAGCGDGRLVYNLRKHNLRLTGVDYSSRAIAFARAFSPDVEFLVGDLTKYRPEKLFDVVCMVEVVEHIQPELLSAVLANVHQCLADDGKLIITVPSKNLKVTPKHYQHFSAEDLRSVVSPYFEVMELYGHIKMGWKYRLFVRMMTGRFIMGTLQRKFWIFKRYLAAAMHVFRSIERCEPDDGAGLIAVCRRT